MGVRFACHACDKRLNIKRELAGRRGVCPACGVRFRIPLGDAAHSTPLESDLPPATVPQPAESVPGANSTATGSARAIDSARAASSARAAGSPSSPSAPTAGKAQPLAALSDASISTWYVRPPSGGQYGPATSDVLRRWIDEGRVASTALLWREGWPQWREAQAILPELAHGLPSAASPHQDARGASETSAGENTENAVNTVNPVNGVTGAVPKQPRGRRELTGGAAARSGNGSDPDAVIGKPQLGRQRRERSVRRTLLIAMLSLLSLTLIIALVVVISRGN